MSIEISDYEPLTPGEIDAFVEDVRGMWQPSGNDQMRLLATVIDLRARLDEAERNGRAVYERMAWFEGRRSR